MRDFPRRTARSPAPYGLRKPPVLFRFRPQEAPRFARQKTKTSSAYEIQSFATLFFHANDAPLLLSHKSFS